MFLSWNVFFWHARKVTLFKVSFFIPTRSGSKDQTMFSKILIEIIIQFIVDCIICLYKAIMYVSIYFCLSVCSRDLVVSSDIKNLVEIEFSPLNWLGFTSGAVTCSTSRTLVFDPTTAVCGMNLMDKLRSLQQLFPSRSFLDFCVEYLNGRSRFGPCVFLVFYSILVFFVLS